MRASAVCALRGGEGAASWDFPSDFWAVWVAAGVLFFGVGFCADWAGGRLVGAHLDDMSIVVAVAALGEGVS